MLHNDDRRLSRMAETSCRPTERVSDWRGCTLKDLNLTLPRRISTLDIAGMWRLQHGLHGEVHEHCCVFYGFGKYCTIYS